MRLGEAEANDGIDLSKLFVDVTDKVYNKLLKAGDIDEATWQATTEELWKAVAEGYAINPNGPFTTADKIILELRTNINVFAAFKNHLNIVELVQELTANGQKVSFSEFKKHALTISEKYNKNYLQAEYNYANAAGRAAEQWKKNWERGGKLLYLTQGDGRVRDSHRQLNGMILSIKNPDGSVNPVWNNYYPPNGWNCRCYTRWRSEDTADVLPRSFPDVKDMFQNNVGITGKVFTDQHPFIKEIGQQQADKIRAAAAQLQKEWEAKHVKP